MSAYIHSPVLSSVFRMSLFHYFLILFILSLSVGNIASKIEIIIISA